jgi:hypothetical protein
MPGPRDTGKLTVNLGSFVGGESIDFKNGVANAFLSSEALDYRSKASQMSILPGASAVSGASAVLTDLPVEMVQDPTGVRWILGDTGKLYKLDTSDVLTLVATLTDGSGAGMVYNQLSDMLYITGQQTVSMYGPLQGTPALKDQQFAKSASSANGVVNLYQTTTTNWDGSARNNLQSLATTQGVTATSQVTTNTAANTYTAPTGAVSELAANTCAFSPDLEPFYSIAVYVKTKGTGNLILTLHDGFNRALATVTILNAALTTGYNEFVFAAPGIRSFTGAIQSGLSAAYHFHVTSTVADTTLGVLTAGQLSSVDFILFNYRLVKTNNGWHPAALFTGNSFMMCIGNGQYLSTYNFSNDANPSNYVFQRERFPLDAGYEVTSLSVNNQYLVIAAEKRSSNSARNFQEGCLYFWDGQNATYNFKIQLPMGAPYSVYTFNNITYFICAGALYAWGGGQQVIKVRPIAYQNTNYLGTTDTTIVNPNMMAPRFNLLMIGYPSVTTNTTLKYGIYSWGAVELIYPNSFGYSYALSHANAANQGYNYSSANNLQIGMVKNFVDTMYVASRKTVSGSTTYFLDRVNNSSQPAGVFSWDSLIWDGGVRYKQKEMCRIKVSFLPWPANATMNIYYALERGSRVSADPISGAQYSPATGDTSIIIDINKRFYEGQWGFFGTCSNPATIPTITGITMEVDPLQSEADLRVDDQAEGS